MEQVLALWRSMEGQDWQLVKLVNCPAAFYKEARKTILRALNEDFDKWTVPITYRVTVEMVHDFD